MLSFSFFFLSFFLFVFSEKPFWDEDKVCMYVCIIRTTHTVIRENMCADCRDTNKLFAMISGGGGEGTPI